MNGRTHRSGGSSGPQLARWPLAQWPLAQCRFAQCVALGLFGALAFGCAEDVADRPSPQAGLHYPASLAMTPDGRYLLTVNTNFDLLYDGGSVTVTDVVTHEFVANAAIEVPSYAGVLALRTAASGQLVGYLPDRSRGALNWFFVEEDTDGRPVLRCSETASTAPAGSSNARTCTPAFRVEESRNESGTIDLGSDPFGIGIREPLADESPYLFTGALSDGTLGVFELDGAGRPSLVDARRLGDAGLYGITSSPRNGLTYVTTQFAQRMYAIVTKPSPIAVEDLVAIDEPAPSVDDPVEVDSPIVDIAVVNLPNADAGSSYAQTVLFDPNRDRAYVAFRAPSAVAVVDTSPDETGSPRNSLLRWISVGNRPAEMALVPRSDGQGALLYVVCFGSDDVYVIDTESLSVVDVIETGDGPFDIVTTNLPSLGIHRAYVSLFDGDAIAVIELDPTSPFFHQVVSHIR